MSARQVFVEREINDKKHTLCRTPRSFPNMGQLSLAAMGASNSCTDSRQTGFYLRPNQVQATQVCKNTDLPCRPKWRHYFRWVVSLICQNMWAKLQPIQFTFLNILIYPRNQILQIITKSLVINIASIEVLHAHMGRRLTEDQDSLPC
ncbi:hypothetical protein L798_15315 [Zootermopsis nevadensis]|uniref:Uncharacterized protein n=1 Tax=Zootermopsis nevadensis TaxID=136037 RepID=A0A067QNT8_ZOONE|nr:hypothetical protein L798_15315 [Zootermopsis nevadensis]